MAGPKYAEGDFAKVAEDSGSFDNPEGLLFKNTIVRICKPLGIRDKKAGPLYDVVRAGDPEEKPVQVGERYLRKLTQEDADLLPIQLVYAEIKLETASSKVNNIRRAIKSLEEAGLATRA
jgi:hypothetical protein